MVTIIVRHENSGWARDETPTSKGTAINNPIGSTSRPKSTTATRIAHQSRLAAARQDLSLGIAQQRGAEDDQSDQQQGQTDAERKITRPHACRGADLIARRANSKSRAEDHVQQARREVLLVNNFHVCPPSASDDTLGISPRRITPAATPRAKPLIDRPAIRVNKTVGPFRRTV